MKKFLAMMLVLAMFSMTMVACSEPSDDGDDTSADTAGDTVADTAADTEADTAADTEADTVADTEADTTEAPAGDEPNMFPYEGDVIPGSIDYDWGAPDAESVYFSIDADHVIHDGKGTWSNSTACVAPMAFDNDFTTFYDCDEKCETANTDEVLVGIPGTWDGDTTLTGYVGAWIEEGVVINQIRFFPRSDYKDRVVGCTFQASVNGENWVDLHTITELVNGGGDYEFIDIDDDTVYYYVRFLGRDLAKYQQYVDDTATETTDFLAYCNIAEMEIWGTPAN